MRTAREHRMSRTIGRLKEIWAELDYAQRRLLEIRTGVPLLAHTERASVRRTIDELEALYAHEDPGSSEL